MARISILMGIYNCAPTLAEAIDSILGQTYTDWELILCDDGSKDNTYQIAEQYKKQHPDKIILLKNEKVPSMILRDSVIASVAVIPGFSARM